MTKKYSILLGLAVLTFIVISTPVQAQNEPIQLALFSPIQIFPEDNHIEGFRFNLLYGRNASVKGLDVGLVNHVTSGLSKGLQVGFLSMADSDFNGLQYSAVNVTKGRFDGFQLGFVNYAHKMDKLQFGIVNYADSLKGIQIGLVNIIKQGGRFPFFPIINWSL